MEGGGQSIEDTIKQLRKEWADLDTKYRGPIQELRDTLTQKTFDFALQKKCLQGKMNRLIKSVEASKYTHILKDGSKVVVLVGFKDDPKKYVSKDAKEEYNFKDPTLYPEDRIHVEGDCRTYTVTPKEWVNISLRNVSEKTMSFSYAYIDEDGKLDWLSDYFTTQHEEEHKCDLGVHKDPGERQEFCFFVLADMPCC
jgi:hypothetical protein